MKKIFFTLFLASTVIANAFAAEVIKLPEVENSKDKMVRALDIAGQEILSSQTVNTDELKVVNQLPIMGKRTFAKMFEGYKIKQTLHFTGNEGEGFYITAENEKESIVVKINEDLEITTFKKLKN